MSSQPWQAHMGTAPGTVPLPGRQLLMSLARSMPSGQAQVNLGEWGLICGAGKHRYSQPPLGRAVLSHQFTPGGKRGRSERRADGIRGTRAEVPGILRQWQGNVFQGRGSPLGCVMLWNRTMSSGDKRFSATKFTSEPVRRLALKMASFMTSVQNTLSYG